MPPSGFSKQAIGGLLEFVRAAYEATLEKYCVENLSQEEILRKTTEVVRQELANHFDQNKSLAINQDGIEGLVLFITSCFEDLIQEIHAGQDKHGREVVDGQAIQKELKQIGEYLEAFTI